MEWTMDYGISFPFMIHEHVSDVTSKLATLLLLIQIWFID